MKRIPAHTPRRHIVACRSITIVGRVSRGIERVMPMHVSSLTLSEVEIGRELFRRRSLTQLPLLLLLVCLPPEFQCSEAVAYCVIAGMIAAEGLRLWAVGYAGKATRTMGEAVGELVQSGPYRFVRNPIYIANVILHSLCGVAFGFFSVSALILLFSCVQYSYVVAFEEDLLSRTFGRRYDHYRENVPRWLPTFSAKIAGERHRFSLQRALRSERSTLITIAAVFLLRSVKMALIAG